MLAAALLLLLPQAADPPPAEGIVITGQRLERLRFSAKVDRKGRVRCKIKRSSGDGWVDRQACLAVEECARLPIRIAKEAEQCVRERLLARLPSSMNP